MIQPEGSLLASPFGRGMVNVRFIMRSAEEQRQFLAQAVLHVRSGRAASRRELADLMKLSPSTAGQYVDQLLEAGLLEETGLEQGAIGRPKRLLNVAPDAGWFAGVEFNAERVQAVRIDFAGRVTGSHVEYLGADVSAEHVLKTIASVIRGLSGRTGAPLLGVGVGCPGVVDPSTGVAVYYAYIPEWNQVPVAERLQKRFEVPVTVDNNLRAIALAERWFGGGKDASDYVILGPRRGFGVAVVHAGKVVRGATDAAGEIGRWPWPVADGTAKQEMQDALNASVVYRRLAGLTNRGRLPLDLRAALENFADSTGEAWDSVIGDYARVIGCLHLLLDAEVYFLHGPLTGLGNRFCEEVAARTVEICPALTDNPPQIVASVLGDNAGALGAASQAMEAWMPDAA